MDDSAFRKLAGEAQLDQAMTGVGNLAKMVAVMYTNYIAGGIPPALAAQLIRDWNYLQTCRSMWPDAPPLMRGGEE